jgi:hypothetical protein
MTELEAGPELDALIAEHIMGLKRHDWQSWSTLEYTVVCAECAKTKQKSAVDRLDCWCKSADGPREFSSDIAWAWMVVDHIANLPTTQETAVFADWWKGAHLWALSAEDAALEICQAVYRIFVEAATATINLSASGKEK